MKPKSLSASSLIKAQACMAMWVATYYHKAREPGGSAANLGTAAHNALQDWVEQGYAHDPKAKFKILEELFRIHYNKLFSDNSRFDEGVEMLRNWYKREHPLQNEVLSTEVKENFPLKVKLADGTDFEVPFNFIWDRCDALTEERCSECGNCPLIVDVVDYKSFMAPMSPDSLKDKIQARSYGVAAQIKYPHAEKIWVSFDLLRYDIIGVRYAREQNVAAYRYMKDMLRMILDTDENDAPETINDQCQWCIRKTECATLRSNVLVGGVHSITDPAEAARRRYAIEHQMKGLKGAKDELDALMLAYAENENLLEFDADDIHVQVTAYGKRVIDAERAAKVIGPELMTRYGSINVGAIDKMIKAKEVTDEQAKELKALMRKQYGDPYIKTSQKNPMDE